MATPAVGCRVRILKDYATVRYIGSVEKQEGTWVGIEWDDPSRGKHDGSTAGVRYFECLSGTTSGSFVRIERVNFGVTVLEALRARYNNETAEHGEEVSPEELYVHTSRKRRVQVQLVGEDKIQQKQRQIHALQSARLVGLDVAAVGDPTALSSALPSLTSLDLTHNLLSCWTQLEALLVALPGLVAVNVSENRLQFPGPASAPPAPQLPGLRVLVLNDCGVTWSQVQAVAPQLPGLQELHLCGNPITTITPPPPPLDPPAPQTQPQQAPGGQQQQGQGQPSASLTPSGAGAGADGEEGQGAAAGVGGQQAEGCSEGSGGGGGEEGEAAAEELGLLFPKLQVLTLEDTQLSGWSAVLPLRRLPALTRLHLGGNTHLTNIVYPAPPPPPAAPTSDIVTPTTTEGAGGGAAAECSFSSSGVPPAFPALTALYLGGCGVADWASVNQLDRFPALRELRLSGNPVLTQSKTGGRFEVIARVSHLTLLNGADVRPRERRDSELRYLQHIAAEMEAAGGDESRRAAVRAAHPRLRQLMQTHGAVLATATRNGAGGGSLAASMVELKITCVAAASHAKMGSQVKKLPRSTTISALRLLCEKLFKVKGTQMALFLRAPGDPLPEAIGGHDSEDRPLGFWGVQDGSEVLVDEVDPETQRRADEDARAAAAAAHEQRLAEQLRAAEKMQAEFARSMGVSQQPQ